MPSSTSAAGRSPAASASGSSSHARCSRTPKLLVLVEPTSAVDAHTEARIARRLREAREGKTTVIITASPLMLDQTDRVFFVEDGRVVAEGTHRELLKTNRAYTWTVTRGEDL